MLHHQNAGQNLLTKRANTSFFKFVNLEEADHGEGAMGITWGGVYGVRATEIV
jgi:hypothetical protein